MYKYVDSDMEAMYVFSYHFDQKIFLSRIFIFEHNNIIWIDVIIKNVILFI